jgi:hypothetical protein
VWIGPRLWLCGHSEIDLISSRFQCLSPSRLVASSHGRYKASYLCCFSSSTLVRTYCHEDRTTHGFVPISTTPSLAAIIAPSHTTGRTPPSLPPPIRRSSRYHHGFDASLLVAWSHPTLVGINLVIFVVFHHLPLFIPTAMKIGPPTGLSLSA